MKTSNRPGRLLGFILISTILPFISLNAQENVADSKSFLNNATEEIPDHPEPTTAKPIQRKKSEIQVVLDRVTEEIPSQPKARFVSTKRYSHQNLKIQLGYFKEKRNVNKLIKKIKSKHNWSVYVKTENKNGNDFYRVMIVDISNKNTANVILSQLKSDGMKGMLR